MSGGENLAMRLEMIRPSREHVADVPPETANETAATPAAYRRTSIDYQHAPRRNRTYNLVIKSHLLCQLS